MTLFEHLDNITHLKNREFDQLTEEEVKTVNIYMINRFVSMDFALCRLANFVQLKMFNEKRRSYSAYMRLFPQSDQKVFFRYIKRSKGVFDPEPDLVTYVMNHFNCSVEDAIENIETMHNIGTLEQFVTDIGKSDLWKKWKKKL